MVAGEGREDPCKERCSGWVKENGAAVRGTAEQGEEAATENQTKRGGRRLLLKKKMIKFFRVRFVSYFFFFLNFELCEYCLYSHFAS